MFYLICCSPRSGSTLLAKGLGLTDLAGYPNEYFGHKGGMVEQIWADRLAIPSQTEYLDRVIACATTPNGVTAMKLHWHQCEFLATRFSAEFDKIAAEHERHRKALRVRGISPLNVIRGAPGSFAFWADQIPSLLSARFDEVKYIWLRRRNIVAQAISYLRAVRTQQWFIFDQKEKIHPCNWNFDLAELDEYVEFIRESDVEWGKLFDRQGISALTVYYEDFVAAYEQTIRSVLAFLGIPDTNIEIKVPELYRQADDWSLRMEDLYWQGKTL